MMIEFAVENYQSFRDKQVLSLVPDESKGEFKENVFKDKNGISLLTSSFIYGANASGKSNLIRAMRALRTLVLFSGSKSPNEPIHEYDPFRFSANTLHAPVNFEFDFLFNGVRHRYEVSFLKYEILVEALYFYPQGREAKLFKRLGQSFEFGEYLKGQKSTIADLTGPNQLFLSKGALNNLRQLVDMFNFFNEDFIPVPFYEFWIGDEFTSQIVHEFLDKPDNEGYILNFKKLLKSFDTGISDIRIELKESGLRNKEYDILFDHKFFDEKGMQVGLSENSILEESEGTRKLFVLAGVILTVLAKGQVLIIDEFERSLHSHISTYIIQMFHNPRINKKGAQLIIATHDTNILSQNELRRDQIWIVEKDSQGCSELFSLADINGVRAGIPFEKWYLSGRFGGIPGIEKLNFELNFQNEALQKQEEKTN